jgi:hypothetical protein
MYWLLENIEWMVLAAGFAVIVGVFVQRALRSKARGPTAGGTGSRDK